MDFLDKQIIILVCSWLRRAGNASQGVSIYFILMMMIFNIFLLVWDGIKGKKDSMELPVILSQEKMIGKID